MPVGSHHSAPFITLPPAQRRRFDSPVHSSEEAGPSTFSSADSIAATAQDITSACRSNPSHRLIVLGVYSKNIREMIEGEGLIVPANWAQKDFEGQQAIHNLLEDIKKQTPTMPIAQLAHQFFKTGQPANLNTSIKQLLDEGLVTLGMPAAHSIERAVIEALIDAKATAVDHAAVSVADRLVLLESGDYIKRLVTLGLNRRHLSQQGASAFHIAAANPHAEVLTAMLEWRDEHPHSDDQTLMQQTAASSR